MGPAGAPRGAVLAGALALACAPGEAERPSVLLLTLDTTRADALSCYGVHADVTPHLDALAAEGVLFEAYTTVPITLPSHASMLSGLYPPRHTIRDNGHAPLPAAAHTTAEAARSAGYQTAAFIAAVVLDDDFGLDQGFDVYDLPPRAADWRSTTPPSRPASDVVDGAIAWLRARDRARPFFLWAHFYDPHGPYEPPEGYREGRFAGEPYLGEVAAMDAEIGRLFETLEDEGVWDDTLVLVVGDHGEALGEHDEVGHGAYLYQSSLLVPFLLRFPDGRRAGERPAGLVSVVDVHPTLTEAMGLPVPPGLDGVSLLGEPPSPDRGLYFESYYGYLSYGWSPLSGWIDAGGKYIHSSAPQFFDVRDDPGETRDLAGTRAETLPRYAAAIGAVAGAPVLENPGFVDLDEELLESIRSLGYAAGGTGETLPHPLDTGDRPSPQSRSDVHDRMVEASRLTAEGRLDEAESVYVRILAENPENWLVREALAALLIRARRPDDAIRTLEALLAGGSDRAVTHYKLGIALRMAGQPDEAVAALERAVVQSRGGARFVRELTRVLRELGREEDAREVERRFPEAG